MLWAVGARDRHKPGPGRGLRGRGGGRGGGISRNLSVARGSAGAGEVRGAPQAAARGISALEKRRRGGGPGCGSPVGSGRGLELGDGLDARERAGWGRAGARTLRPPGASPRLSEVTAGILVQ